MPHRPAELLQEYVRGLVSDIQLVADVDCGTPLRVRDEQVQTLEDFPVRELAVVEETAGLQREIVAAVPAAPLLMLESLDVGPHGPASWANLLRQGAPAEHREQCIGERLIPIDKRVELVVLKRTRKWGKEEVLRHALMSFSESESVYG